MISRVYYLMLRMRSEPVSIVCALTVLGFPENRGVMTMSISINILAAERHNGIHSSVIRFVFHVRSFPSCIASKWNGTKAVGGFVTQFMRVFRWPEHSLLPYYCPSTVETREIYFVFFLVVAAVRTRQWRMRSGNKKKRREKELTAIS